MSDDSTTTATSPIRAEDVLNWLENTAAAVRAGTMDEQTLVDLLGELRRASAACADASDWILLAAREEGVSLRRLAPTFGKGYVRAPAARLEKLHRQALTSEQWLQILRSRAHDPTLQP